MGLRGPPRTRAHQPRMATGSIRPVRRSNHPSGTQLTRRPSGRSLRAALHGLPLPFRAHHRDPAPSRRLPGKSDDTSSHGLRLPYDTVSSRRTRSSVADPSTTACRVRGLSTPCATSTTGPPGACAPERPWASPFKGFSSTAIGAPLGAHCPPDVARRTATPRGGKRTA
jgi:hypothetical protein